MNKFIKTLFARHYLMMNPRDSSDSCHDKRNDLNSQFTQFT